MSDFLTRMSERALGLAQPVQPLIPSVYAANTAAPLEAEPALNEVTIEHESDRSPAKPLERQTIRRQAANVELQPAQTPPSSAYKPLVPTTPIEPAPEQSLLVPRLEREMPENLSDDIAPFDAENTAEPPRGLARAAMTPHPVPSLNEGNSTRYEASLLPPHAEHEPFFEERPASAQTAPDTQPNSAITPQTPRAAQIASPFDSIAEAESLLNSTDTDAPLNIRVTINRVEIRGMLPQAAPTQTSAPRESAPTLSLDDYLQRRGRGR